jgi:hypothetical protein
MGAEAPSVGWIVDGFEAVVALWFWAVVVLLYAAWRAVQGPETDPIRPSGPVD